MDDGRRLRGAGGMLLVALSMIAMQGCAGIAEGVTRGLTAEDEEKPPRACARRS